MRRPLVIYTHGAGRLGNQVLRFLHWIAWVRANQETVQVLNFAFWQSARYFSVWREHPGCVFPVQAGRADSLARLLEKLPQRVVQWCDDRWLLQRRMHGLGELWPHWQALSIDDQAGERIDLETPEFLHSVQSRSLSTCAGWQIAGWKYVAEQQDALREWFRPAEGWRRRSEEFIGELRTRYDLVVGLLIRQSDYRTWNDGRFLFSTVQYARWIEQLLDLHLGRKTVVVIASEAWQDPEVLLGLPYVFAPGAKNLAGHWFDSFVALSLCDFVVSPPSTFSAVAAFVGNIPLLPLTGATQQLSSGDLLPNALVDAASHPIFSIAVK
jgi:hypothetical protein